MMMTTNPPLRSPERTPDQPSREVLGLGGGSVSKNAMISSLLFFLPKTKYVELELRLEELQGAHEVRGAPQGVGAPPTLVRRVWPPGLHLWRGFFIVFSKMFRGVSGHSENICFLHIKQHHGNSAKNNVSPGQFHSNHTSQSPKQGQKCLEKQIRRRRINSPKLKPLLVLKQFS